MTALGSVVTETLFGSVWGRVAAGLVVAAIVGLAVSRALGAHRATLAERVAPYVTDEDAGRRDPGPEGETRFARLARLFAATERAIGETGPWHALSALLARAGMRVQTVEFVYLAALCGLVPAALLGAVSGSLLAFVLLAVIGAAAPVAVVAVKARRRTARFDEQLPDVLLTLASALKAGHTFAHGMQNVVEEGRAPASEEFERVLAELRLGKPVELALTDMAARVGSEDFRFVLSAVAIQREVGGSLGSLLELVADTVRQRQQFARKVRSLTAMGRLSANVLIALPFGTAAIIVAINHDYIDPLLHESTGRTMLLVALGMLAVGALSLRRLANVRG
jgi:tight adherence protein B